MKDRVTPWALIAAASECGPGAEAEAELARSRAGPLNGTTERHTPDPSASRILRPPAIPPSGTGDRDDLAGLNVNGIGDLWL